MRDYKSAINEDGDIESISSHKRAKHHHHSHHSEPNLKSHKGSESRNNFDSPMTPETGDLKVVAVADTGSAHHHSNSHESHGGSSHSHGHPLEK